MAPLIDVVFLLLLFFVLTSTFREPEAIDLTLPSSQTAAAAEDHTVEIAIASDGGVHLNDEAVPLERLAGAIRTTLGDDADQPIAFKTDAEVSVQRMLEVVDEIRLGGGHNLAFMTERSSPGVKAVPDSGAESAQPGFAPADPLP